MAFQPKENWQRVGGPDEAPTWQVTTDEAWNWTILRSEPMKAVFGERAENAFKVGEPPVKVLAKLGKADEWKMDGANCGATPIQPGVRRDSVETVELVPFGFTSLRISQFPIADDAE